MQKVDFDQQAKSTDCGIADPAVDPRRLADGSGARRDRREFQKTTCQARSTSEFVLFVSVVVCSCRAQADPASGLYTRGFRL